MSREQEINEQNEESPADKLRDTPQSAETLTPGTQKPESEVQDEEGVNTE
ncbi:MAG: hypothetical protein ACRD68_10630 [Pyrinomonadaceae bacterium]